MRCTEIVSNVPSHFPSGSSEGKSAWLLPMGEWKSPGGTFPSKAFLLQTFHSSEDPLGKEKGVWPVCLRALCLQTVFTASTIDSCLFSPSFSSLIELLVSSLHILLGWCICIYSSMCVRLFFPLFSFLFASDCTSDFSTGNDKDTTRQLTASPGYIANSSFAFSKAYFW